MVSVLFLQKQFGLSKILSALSFRLKLILIDRYLRKHKILVINSHAIKQNYTFGLLKAKLTSLKFVLTLHGHYELLKSENLTLFKASITQVVNFVDELIYLSDEQLNNFKLAGFDTQKATRILNGFEIEKSVSMPSDFNKNFNTPLSLMIHSRAIPEKGWKEAIEAFFILKKKGYNIMLTLVGTGEQYGALKEQFSHPDLLFVGFSNDVFEHIRTADIGLLPSYFYGESLPNSIVEYLSFGIPVVASNIGAIAQMLKVNDDLAGDLIETSKGIPVKSEVLSTIIEKYIIDKNYLSFKRKLAFEAFRKFEMTHCIEAYKSLLFNANA
jgi:glycosyltransferase involved in cell wall biosynthesis